MKNSLIPKRDIFLSPFEETFNSIFDDFFNNSTMDSIKSRSNYPKVDVYEENGKYKIEVAVPGVHKDDLSIEVKTVDNRQFLVISGRMTEKRTDFYIKELRRSAFERHILIPEKVKGDPNAVLLDGILTLSWDLPEVVLPEIKKINISTP